MANDTVNEEPQDVLQDDTPDAVKYPGKLKFTLLFIAYAFYGPSKNVSQTITMLSACV